MGLRVVGIARTSVTAVDQTAVLIHLDDARRLTGVPTATTVDLDVARGSEEAVARRVQELLPAGLTARGVWDLVGPIKSDVESNRLFAHVLAMVVYAFAALAVTSTVFVGVMERTRELGVISALGVTPRRLGALVTLEALFTCVLGWFGGLILGYGAAWALATYNILGPLFAAVSAAMPAAGLSEEVYGAVRRRTTPCTPAWSSPRRWCSAPWCRGGGPPACARRRRCGRSRDGSGEQWRFSWRSGGDIRRRR